ncbi:MAG: hypothetical protein HC779_03530, partial [Phyllobacteriaceae bacterium]|nr:hypothetical protein [Phyllobacteriaceae bacterium]
MPYGLIRNGAVVMDGPRIAWVGEAAMLPAQFAGAEAIRLDGRLVTPGLVDCHTHVVFAGNRAAEFEQRLNGASYEDIARAGGGIQSTVTATRRIKDAPLLAETLARVDAMMGEGVTTLEIKSGYGLDIDTEIKMLRVARVIGRIRPLGVVTSFLGAHAVPVTYAGRADAYLDEVCFPALEAAHAARFVDAVDGFCEGIAFSPAQIERLFNKARSLGLPVKLHAEQLSNLGGAALDTFALEPPPADWPLLRLPNVTLTPHIAGASQESAQRGAESVAQDVANFLPDDPCCIVPIERNWGLDNMTQPLLIGIDIGTTSTKAVLVDAQGNLLGEASQEYRTHYPHPNWAEQDPEDWWRATCAVLPRLLAATQTDPAAIAGVGISCQAPTMTALDHTGQPIYPALIWLD